MAVEAAAHGLTRFVDCVLQRVDDLEAAEIDAFRRDWAAISGATPDEREGLRLVGAPRHGRVRS